MAMRNWCACQLVFVSKLHQISMKICPMGAGDEGESALARLGSALAGLGDLERGLTRALHKTASPAELVATLRALASVGAALGLQARAHLLPSLPQCLSL